jgi:hypothetical protein
LFFGGKSDFKLIDREAFAVSRGDPRHLRDVASEGAGKGCVGVAAAAEHRQVHPADVRLQPVEQRLQLRQPADRADEPAEHPAVSAVPMKQIFAERFGHGELRRREQPGVIDDAGHQDADAGEHGNSSTAPKAGTPVSRIAFRPCRKPCLEMVPPFARWVRRPRAGPASGIGYNPRPEDS